MVMLLLAVLQLLVIKKITSSNMVTFAQFQTIPVKLVSGYPPNSLGPTFDVRFKSSKTDTNYDYSLSINSLQVTSDSNNRYTILVKVIQNGKKNDGMTISLDSKSSRNLISRLTIAWLVVDSSLKHLISITHFNYKSPKIEGTQYSRYGYDRIKNSMNITRRLQGRYRIMVTVSGVDISSKYPNFLGFASNYSLRMNQYRLEVNLQTQFYHNIINSIYKCYAHEFVLDIFMINYITTKMNYMFDQKYYLQVGSPSESNYYRNSAVLSQTAVNKKVSWQNFPSTRSYKQVFFLIQDYQLNATVPQTPTINFKLDRSFPTSTEVSMLLAVSLPTQYLKVKYLNIFELFRCIKGYQWNITQQQCLPCPTGQLFSTNYKPDCMQCESLYCSLCNGTVCLACQPLFTLLSSSNVCVPNCQMISSCSSCFIYGNNVTCLECYQGFKLDFYSNKCSPQFKMKQRVLVKKEDKNQFTYRFTLIPQLQIYKSINWKEQLEVTFQPIYSSYYYYDNQNRYLRSQQEKNSPTDISSLKAENKYVTIIQASYNHSSNRFYIKLNYSSQLRKTQFALKLARAPYLKITFSRPKNNLSLFAFSEDHYQLATVIKYLSIAVAIFTLSVFISGYFRDKTVALQSVSVVQLAALLLTTQYWVHPTVYQLRNLSIVLGFTSFTEPDYQISKFPCFVNILIASPNVFTYVNIFLVVVFIPPILALILKILVKTKYKNNLMLQYGWRCALGSNTYYGLLFLCNGICSFLAVNLRYFSHQTSCYVSLGTGIVYIAVLVAYVVFSSNYYQFWFGQFKLKFRNVRGAQHVYTIETIQRILTPLVILCPGVGMISVTCPVIIYTFQVIFFAVKKPHIQGERGPILRKVALFAICLLYFGLTCLGMNQSIGHTIIPFFILIILNAVLILSWIDLGRDIKQKKKQRQDNKKEIKKEEVQSIQKEIEMKLALENQQRYNTLRHQFESKPFDRFPTLKQQLTPKAPTNQIREERQIEENIEWKPIEVAYNRMDGDKGFWQEQDGLCSLKQLKALKARLRKQYKNESQRIKKQEFQMKSWQMIEFDSEKE